MDNSKAKVLIIEDEQVLLDVLQDKLEKEGYLVAVARDGQEGLDQARSFQPAVILLDIIMPKVDGFQFLESMQQDESIKKIPVMIISNSGQPVEIERALKLGVKDYIIKTEFDPQEVLKKMEKILAGQGEPAPGPEGEVETKPVVAPAVLSSQPSDLTESPSQAPTETPAVTPGSKTKKASILIVEDDKFLRDLLVHKLEEAGYSIEVAIDGEEGLKKIEQMKPNLVLLDLILPGIDGFGVLEQMRKSGLLDKSPVIILSNLGQQEEVERGLGLGARDYMIKAHFTPQEVAERIKKVLGR